MCEWNWCIVIYLRFEMDGESGVADRKKQLILKGVEKERCARWRWHWWACGRSDWSFARMDLARLDREVAM